MEHFNPILGNDTTGQKFITCGEIMLRLTPPNYEKIRMASGFEASYGGSEANIALALVTLVWTAPSSAWCPTTVWARAPCAGCVPTTCTAPL